MKPDEVAESSEESDDNGELKIPEQFSSDKHNKILKFNYEKDRNVTSYSFLNMLQKKDEEMSISEKEFKEIPFPYEWPMIMRDICQ